MFIARQNNTFDPINLQRNAISGNFKLMFDLADISYVHIFNLLLFMTSIIK